MRIVKNGIACEAPDREPHTPEPLGLIEELKAKLAETDYKTLKYVEGELTEEEFLAEKLERALWRAEINRLEAELDEQEQ